MMSNHAHLFVQPLLDTTDQWAAYLVTHAVEHNAVDQILQELLASPIKAEFPQNTPWLLPHCPGQPPAFWGDDENRLVLPATTMPSPHETELRQARRKLFATCDRSSPLPPPGTWDGLLVECDHARTLPNKSLDAYFGRTQLVITHVEAHSDAHWFRAQGPLWISSEFLLTRAAPAGKADLTRLKLLELLGLLAADADTTAIEQVFRQEPKLAYSLLRLVNSAANAPRSPITSFSRAIALLGRRQLQRWLQLLVYADPNNGQKPNPLLQKAANRGRLIELLSQQLCPETQAHETDLAFMTGTFSLLDVLLHIPMTEIIEQLPLPHSVRLALGDRSGPLGTLLLLLEASERGALAEAERQLDELGISPSVHLTAQLQALSWASRIHAGE